jgi:hypothetical protein
VEDSLAEEVEGGAESKNAAVLQEVAVEVVHLAEDVGVVVVVVPGAA